MAARARRERSPRAAEPRISRCGIPGLRHQAARPVGAAARPGTGLSGDHVVGAVMCRRAARARYKRTASTAEREQVTVLQGKEVLTLPSKDGKAATLAMTTAARPAAGAQCPAPVRGGDSRGGGAMSRVA